VATPYLAGISYFSFDVVPEGWAYCSGQLLPINQNQALFSLLGIRYGGNGQTNFALPNLQGRVPVHAENGNVGASYGTEAVTVSIQQLPPHTHEPQAATGRGTAAAPTAGATWAAGSRAPLYTGGADTGMRPAGTVASVGGGQPHTNMQPYTVLNACIALQGVFPSQN
jgi:microcystin-dependent protein